MAQRRGVMMGLSTVPCVEVVDLVGLSNTEESEAEEIIVGRASPLMQSSNGCEFSGQSQRAAEVSRAANSEDREEPAGVRCLAAAVRRYGGTFR